MTKYQVGLACGIFIAAVHNANLCALSSSAKGADSQVRCGRACAGSPRQVRSILGRPATETVFLIFAVGECSCCTVARHPLAVQHQAVMMFMLHTVDVCAYYHCCRLDVVWIA